MTRLLLCLLAVATLLPRPAQAAQLAYPAAPKSDHVDDYHGTKVPDPYRWLEDANSPQTKAWVEAENKVTFGYLRQLPGWQPIHDRVTSLWDYEKFGVPLKEGGRYLFFKNTGVQNQSVIYSMAKLGDEPSELLDPNRLSDDGTVALSSYAISKDGRYMAYGLSTAGSDWIDWHVKDVATGIDRTDQVKWSKFSGASWTADGKGFFYSRYDEPDARTQLQSTNFFQKLCYHRVGEPQAKDTLVYERKDQKEWGFGGDVTEDGKYLVIQVSQGTDPRNRVFYRALPAGDVAAAPVVELLRDLDARYTFVGNDDATFFFLTDKDAPRGRLVAVDTARVAAAPDGKPALREIIPQAGDALQGVSYVGGRFVATYLRDAHSRVEVFERDGKGVGEVPFPGLGTASGFGGKADDPETFYAFTSYTTPLAIFRYDVRTGEGRQVFAPKVTFDPAMYVTEQAFYPSRDGTKIPMLISYKKGLHRDGNNPTLLFGYGGFDISLTPTFSPANLAWMEMGGIFAVPNLRGGGEYGEEWHLAGTHERKQNVFDDFIAAAEWLIAQKYTSTPRLAVYGRSNGGLLVGAVLTQRPDLFGATLPTVGVMDMLRFQKFTIGWGWTSDYGSSDDPAQFAYLYAYSPLHHLKPGVHYPPTLVTTSDHDDRVVPAHSFKFAATLQADQGGDAPVLIRVETNAGHAGGGLTSGLPTSKQIDEVTDKWAFLKQSLGMKD